MAEPRLYLYRKAGRQVWDAEMWLPDGRRRVWRTRLEDRAEAESAARVRLEAMAMATSDTPITSLAAAGSVVSKPPVRSPKPDVSVSTRPDACELAAREEPVPADESWSERFDRWFLSDLADGWL